MDRRSGGRARGWARTALAVVAALGPVAAASGDAASSAQAALPPIHHVFVIVLENEDASDTFSTPAPAPYLAVTMRAAGAYIPNYYGVGHDSLDNYVAMISGQAPNPDTQADCQTFVNFPADDLLPDGQENGQGCVYPADVPTLPQQLQGAGLTWGAYEEDMGADPARESSVCGHPAVGGPDDTQIATPTDQYATRHDPFVYFHWIIDTPAQCDNVVNLDQLPAALSSVATTPNYVFITPDLCSDGHDAVCANPALPGGYAGINGFLSKWVPMITSSPAYQADGLLIVTFDEADAGAGGDPGSCCGELPGPTGVLPGLTGPGGGDVGAVLLSPFITPGTISSVAYNHYSMLGSVEDIFGRSRLGYAAGTTAFGSDIFEVPESVVEEENATTSSTSTSASSSAPTGGGGTSPPATVTTVTTTMTSPPPATSTPAAHRASCTIPVLPHKLKGGALPGTAFVRSVSFARSKGHRVLTFTAVRPAKLKIAAKPKKGKTKTLASITAVACRAYRYTVPAGHGTVTIRASAAGGKATISRTY